MNYNSISKVFHLNGHARNSIDGVAAVNNGVPFKTVTTPNLQSTLEGLNEGYYQEIATGKQVINPKYPLPVSGWKAVVGGGMHNRVSSYINMNPTGSADPKFDIWNKSKTAVFKQLIRDSLNYFSGNPWLWNITELDYDYLLTVYEAAYVDKTFPAFKDSYAVKKFLSMILVYKTQKTGVDKTKVLNSIGY